MSLHSSRLPMKQAVMAVLPLSRQSLVQKLIFQAMSMLVQRQLASSLQSPVSALQDGMSLRCRYVALFARCCISCATLLLHSCCVLSVCCVKVPCQNNWKSVCILNSVKYENWSVCSCTTWLSFVECMLCMGIVLHSSA